MSDALVKNSLCIAGLLVGGVLILGGIGAYYVQRAKHFVPEDAVDNSVRGAIQVAIGPIAGGVFIIGASLWLWSRAWASS